MGFTNRVKTLSRVVLFVTYTILHISGLMEDSGLLVRGWILHETFLVDVGLDVHHPPVKSMHGLYFLPLRRRCTAHI